MLHRVVPPRVSLLTECSGPGHRLMSQPWKPHATEGGTGGPLGYRNASNTARRHYGSGDTRVKSAPKFRIQVWGVVGVIVVFGSRGW